MADATPTPPAESPRTAAPSFRLKLPKDEQQEDGLPTTVVLRRWSTTGAPFALFPFLEGDGSPEECQSFQHVGQHSTAHYLHCIGNSEPVQPSDYAVARDVVDLIHELEGRGYMLQTMTHEQAMMEVGRRELMDEQAAEAGDWTRCPGCESESGPEGGAIDIENGRAVQECSCNDCGAQWVEWYRQDNRVLS